MSEMSARVTRKRARTAEEDENSSSIEKAEENAETANAINTASGTEELTRDSEFWHDDGTVILVARDVEFRVYSGLLVAQSPVFKDLFSHPQSVRPMTVNGIHDVPCPVVHLSDSPNDLRHILRICMPSCHEFHLLMDQLTSV